MVVEIALAAIFSFTLVAPLGVPWWAPLVAFAAVAAVFVGMQRVARNRRTGIWRGIAVLRETKGSGRIVALVCLAVVIQIARNWLLLNYSGVDASVFDSTALLIGLAVVGLLPIGPSLGAATAVLILGTNGVAASAAAGALADGHRRRRRALLRKLGADRPALDAAGNRAGSGPHGSGGLALHRFGRLLRRGALTASRGERAPAAPP